MDRGRLKKKKKCGGKMKTFEDMISMALFVVRKQCGMITRGHIMQVITMNDFASLSGQN